jgi:hypothetical protein
VVLDPLVGDTDPHALAEHETVHAGVPALFTTVAVKLCVLPAFSVTLDGATETETTGAVTVIVAVAVFAGLLTDVEVSVTVEPGTEEGAVYVTDVPDATLLLGVTVPHEPVHASE